MSIIEKRRIHKAGGSMAITLPKGWLAYFEIECGDEVQLVVDGELTIRPMKKRRETVGKEAQGHAK